MPQPPRLNDLKSLFPAQVEVALSTMPPDSTASLPPAEAVAMTAMAPKRRREFIHGRVCARTALTALGLADQTIPVGSNREPVWPDGIVGSISHCEQTAVAVVARRSDVKALGIDLEISTPLDDDVLNLVCVPEERNWSRTTDNPLQYAKLIFSAKESIYKCIWPIVRRFVDFQDIRIHIDINTGTFSPIAWTNDLPDATMRRITGQYLLQDPRIVTAACIMRLPSVADRIAIQTGWPIV